MRMHCRALTFEQLEDGTNVVFNIEEGNKGPQATVVALPPSIAVKVS